MVTTVNSRAKIVREWFDHIYFWHWLINHTVYRVEIDGQAT